MGVHLHVQHTAFIFYWKVVGCEPSNDEIDGATKLKGIPMHAYPQSILTCSVVDPSSNTYNLCFMGFVVFTFDMMQTT